ncbi:MAG TPA: glycosyltransferase family 4 protein [Vicinamibacterales bacterium]|jgi:glycosyltransferase involved in cell wall biosynthesis|nr:glycosyltransferase family 4 protein [Vicinamibacterales bacterium]
MRILHVTPHLPPDQAANALLPWQLGNWARDAGDSVEYVAHPARAGGRTDLAGPVTWLPRRSGGFFDRTLRVGSLFGAWRIQRALAPLLARADVVHAHSNGLLSEVAVLAAVRAKKPVVLTLYGTEIWHYRRKRGRPDLFTRAYHDASYVTFYSERLMGRAFELGLRRRNAQVIYPPVGEGFTWHDDEQQAEERAALGIGNRHLLLNVKRLHPLAGQRILIEAMMDVVHAHPDTRLVVCGEGQLRDELQAAARSAGVERHVDFTGLVDNVAIARYCAAADLFVLPSLLEALPTVAVEALACGTPVLSSDNPGGLELNGLFGPDVSIVPGEQPLALGKAITHFLQNKRRTLSGTKEVIDREFRPDAVARQYWAIYEEVGTCR